MNFIQQAKWLIAFVLFLFGMSIALPAFTGAEGWGADTKGGRGGKVCVVTNLNDAGAGSFRAALLAKGPRIIVFRVSGVINLAAMTSSDTYLFMDSSKSFVTVAGQTSPGGITLHGTGHTIISCYDNNFHDWVFRFLRIRSNPNGVAGVDGVSFNTADHFIIDHCDFSGGSDGTMDIPRSHHWTVQWTTIANSAFCCYDHGGSLFAYNPTHHISLHHNVWANHEQRCGGYFHWVDVPGYVVPEGGYIDYRNNVCYNGMYNLFSLDAAYSAGPIYLNVAGNNFIEGPNLHVTGRGLYDDVEMKNATVYDLDNAFIQKDGSRNTNVLSTTQKYLAPAATPYDMPSVTTYSSSQAYDTVMNKTGAWPRDSMNRRTMSEIRTFTGRLLNDSATFITAGPAPASDADSDGMPDFWETGMGLNPNDYADAVRDLDGSGYTNIEKYLNDLARARLCEDYLYPVYPIPTGWADYNPACCKSTALDGVPVATKGVTAMRLTPNPVRGRVTIELARTQGHAVLQIFDLRGRKVAMFEAGNHCAAVWDAGQAAPGIYFVSHVADGKTMETRRITVVRYMGWLCHT